MPLRQVAAAAVAVWIAVAACAPDVPYTAPPASVVMAVFDPVNGQIPLPNDLVLRQLQQDAHALDGKAPPAQIELLSAFNAAGGFPNDQEVAVTIDFTRTAINADGTTTNTAPDLDLTTFVPGNVVAFLATSPSQVGPVALDAIQAGDYVKGSDRGTLTLHNKGRLPWAPGQYILGVRGGPSGVKTAATEPVYPSQVFFLLAQGQHLDTEQNLGLLAAQAGSRAKALPLAQQLDAIIDQYGVPLALVNSVFPQRELAVMATFAIAPAATQVQLDPARGLVPLPIDLLRDPRPPSASCPACGKLTARAACTLAGGKQDASGNCSSAAAAGFATLDGFSTTGAILAPASGNVRAQTVTSSTLQLYDLTNPAAPALVSPSTLIVEPCEFTSSCSDAFTLSPVIALQPAGATAGDPTSVFRTRPLKDNTKYAVVISDGVLDQAGKPLGRGTVGRILLFQNPLVDASGSSQLVGVDDNTAGALEVMRQQLQPVLSAAAGNGITANHVAMAYTFKTQSILSVATKLGALPYTTPDATAIPGAVTALTPTQAFTKYGVNQQVPHNHLAEILETTITTFNLLDPGTGAFNPDPSKAVGETIKVLIGVPKVSGGAPTLAPVILFRHGLGRGRVDMLPIADTFAAQGLVTVSIDAAKHGDRSFCTPGVVSVQVPGVGAVPICVGAGSSCISRLPAGAQGDAAPPGVCVNGDGSAGSFTKLPVGCGGDNGCLANATDGIPLVSANYLVSANFFRTRDTFRQDIIDQSQLIRAVVLTPPSPITGATGHSIFDRLLFTDNVIIDPRLIYYSGQSLGAIQGTLDVAANPRISKAVLNVGGGTIVDIFTNSPSFSAGTNQLLAGLGIKPGTSAYLQFLVVAKTILDPADPVNFAGHLTANTLPNLLPPLGGAIDGSVPQAAKKILTQAAFCDQVVPNPFNFILDATAGTGPRLIDPTFGAPGTFELFFKGSAAPSAADLASCPAPGSTAPLPTFAVSHGFLIDWSDQIITGKAQADAAAFVVFDTKPNSLVVLP
jgi:hypothetical protein